MNSKSTLATAEGSTPKPAQSEGEHIENMKNWL